VALHVTAQFLYSLRVVPTVTREWVWQSQAAQWTAQTFASQRLLLHSSCGIL